ncbi:hypothetical protein RUESEDTHA_03583 [Ruegeria sp. THAF57]|uniref:hypothetical protein n=1 Tax=Ruegeria sp. THAF57 TaxID=2744555 RepID=UPI00177033B0|nr:hypothetical protein [Ruegeria sp. THAF57]CAD0186674.1 hypothetical protein RUESEDTHA_03583 [Ruegeria sp. THAF57]
MSGLGVSPRLSVRGSRARILVIFLVISALVFGMDFQAAANTQNPYVVGNDRGGYLHDRLIELENLQRNRVLVEIRGRVCFSTCTMFLGLPGTCVDAETIFGFHGPSRTGRKLPKKDFDYFSRVMADYYPEPLKSWFMNKARNRISGVYKVKGAELIRMGISPCREV